MLTCTRGHHQGKAVVPGMMQVSRTYLGPVNTLGTRSHLRPSILVPLEGARFLNFPSGSELTPPHEAREKTEASSRWEAGADNRLCRVARRRREAHEEVDKAVQVAEDELGLGQWQMAWEGGVLGAGDCQGSASSAHLCPCGACSLVVNHTDSPQPWSTTKERFWC